MATLDWSQCQAVESIPGKVSGAWVFRDTRWGRSMLDLFHTLQDLQAWGVSLVAQTGLQFDLHSAQVN